MRLVIPMATLLVACAACSNPTSPTRATASPPSATTGGEDPSGAPNPFGNGLFTFQLEEQDLESRQSADEVVYGPSEAGRCQLRFSEQGRVLELTKPESGALAGLEGVKKTAEPGMLRGSCAMVEGYPSCKLDPGTLGAGATLRVFAEGRQWRAELLVSGSGVPLIAAFRGPLSQVP